MADSKVVGHAIAPRDPEDALRRVISPSPSRTRHAPASMISLSFKLGRFALPDRRRSRPMTALRMRSGRTRIDLHRGAEQLSQLRSDPNRQRFDVRSRSAAYDQRLRQIEVRDQNRRDLTCAVHVPPAGDASRRREIVNNPDNSGSASASAMATWHADNESVILKRQARSEFQSRRHHGVDVLESPLSPIESEHPVDRRPQRSQHRGNCRRRHDRRDLMFICLHSLPGLDRRSRSSAPDGRFPPAGEDEANRRD